LRNGISLKRRSPKFQAFGRAVFALWMRSMYVPACSRPSIMIDDPNPTWQSSLAAYSCQMIFVFDAVCWTPEVGHLKRSVSGGFEPGYVERGAYE
jgi:hypothetical protein